MVWASSRATYLNGKRLEKRCAFKIKSRRKQIEIIDNHKRSLISTVKFDKTILVKLSKTLIWLHKSSQK